MGRVIRKIDEAQRAIVEKYEIVLRRPRVVETIDYVDIEARVLDGFEGFVIRSRPWRNTLKTKDRRRIAISMANHYFCRYRAPWHLASVWGDALPKGPSSVKDEFETTRKLYYICVAQGGSLHKEYMRPTFTRAETHWFTNAPDDVGFADAHWYAIARGHGAGLGRALKIAKTKLGRDRKPFTSFWKDATRFFAEGENISVGEIDDIIDYFTFRIRENPDFNLRGRTIASAREQTLQWHRDLARMKRIGDGVWTGLPVPNWRHEIGKEGRTDVWTMTQILTGKDLAIEGNTMHHCVSSYKNGCAQGRISIWSLRENDSRALTVELNHDERRITQARGRANRRARHDETAVLTRWARDMGFHSGVYW